MIDPLSGYTMLMLKVEEGNLEEVMNIVKKNTCKINAQNKSGQTALALATRNGSLPIVEFLVNNGADINIRNKPGQTPLFIACWFNFENIVNFLLHNNADVNIGDHRGWTPLMIACYHGYSNIVKVLLKYNSDISIVDCFGKRAVDRCKKKQIINLLKLQAAKTILNKHKDNKDSKPLDNVYYDTGEIPNNDDSLPTQKEHIYEVDKDIDQQDFQNQNTQQGIRSINSKYGTSKSLTKFAPDEQGPNNPTITPSDSPLRSKSNQKHENALKINRADQCIHPLTLLDKPKVGITNSTQKKSASKEKKEPYKKPVVSSPGKDLPALNERESRLTPKNIMKQSSPQHHQHHHQQHHQYQHQAFNPKLLDPLSLKLKAKHLGLDSPENPRIIKPIPNTNDNINPVTETQNNKDLGPEHKKTISQISISMIQRDNSNAFNLDKVQVQTPLEGTSNQLKTPRMNDPFKDNSLNKSGESMTPGRSPESKLLGGMIDSEDQMKNYVLSPILKEKSMLGSMAETREIFLNTLKEYDGMIALLVKEKLSKSINIQMRNITKNIKAKVHDDILTTIQSKLSIMLDNDQIECLINCLSQSLLYEGDGQGNDDSYANANDDDGNNNEKAMLEADNIDEDLLEQIKQRINDIQLKAMPILNYMDEEIDNPLGSLLLETIKRYPSCINSIIRQEISSRCNLLANDLTASISTIIEMIFKSWNTSTNESQNIKSKDKNQEINKNKNIEDSSAQLNNKPAQKLNVKKGNDQLDSGNNNLQAANGEPNLKLSQIEVPLTDSNSLNMTKNKMLYDQFLEKYGKNMNTKLPAVQLPNQDNTIVSKTKNLSEEPNNADKSRKTREHKQDQSSASSSPKNNLLSPPSLPSYDAPVQYPNKSKSHLDTKNPLTLVTEQNESKASDEGHDTLTKNSKASPQNDDIMSQKKFSVFGSRNNRTENDLTENNIYSIYNDNVRKSLSDLKAPIIQGNATLKNPSVGIPEPRVFVKKVNEEPIHKGMQEGEEEEDEMLKYYQRPEDRFEAGGFDNKATRFSVLNAERPSNKIPIDQQLKIGKNFDEDSKVGIKNIAQKDKALGYGPGSGESRMMMNNNNKAEAYEFSQKRKKEIEEYNDRKMDEYDTKSKDKLYGVALTRDQDERIKQIVNPYKISERYAEDNEPINELKKELKKPMEKQAEKREDRNFERLIERNEGRNGERLIERNEGRNFERPIERIDIRNFERPVEGNEGRNFERPFERKEKQNIERPVQRNDDQTFERIEGRNFERPSERIDGRNFERPIERSEHRNFERSIERNEGQKFERPSERSEGQKFERNENPKFERPFERSQGLTGDKPIIKPESRNFDRPFERNESQKLEKPFDRSGGFNLERLIPRTEGRNLERPIDRNEAQKLERPFERNECFNLERSIPKIEGRNFERPIERSEGPYFERPIERSEGRNLERPLEKTEAQNFKKGLEKNENQSSERPIQRAEDRNIERIIEKNEGQDLERPIKKSEALNFEKPLERNEDRTFDNNIEIKKTLASNLNSGLDKPISSEAKSYSSIESISDNNKVGLSSDKEPNKKYNNFDGKEGIDQHNSEKNFLENLQDLKRLVKQKMDKKRYKGEEDKLDPQLSKQSQVNPRLIIPERDTIVPQSTKYSNKGEIKFENDTKKPSEKDVAGSYDLSERTPKSEKLNSATQRPGEDTGLFEKKTLLQQRFEMKEEKFNKQQSINTMDTVKNELGQANALSSLQQKPISLKTEDKISSVNNPLITMQPSKSLSRKESIQEEKQDPESGLVSKNLSKEIGKPSTSLPEGIGFKRNENYKLERKPTVEEILAKDSQSKPMLNGAISLKVPEPNTIMQKVPTRDVDNLSKESKKPSISLPEGIGFKKKESYKLETKSTVEETLTKDTQSKPMLNGAMNPKVPEPNTIMQKVPTRDVDNLSKESEKPSISLPEDIGFKKKESYKLERKSPAEETLTKDTQSKPMLNEAMSPKAPESNSIMQKVPTSDVDNQGKKFDSQYTNNRDTTPTTIGLSNFVSQGSRKFTEDKSGDTIKQQASDNDNNAPYTAQNKEKKEDIRVQIPQTKPKFFEPASSDISMPKVQILKEEYPSSASVSTEAKKEYIKMPSSSINSATNTPKNIFLRESTPLSQEMAPNDTNTLAGKRNLTKPIDIPKDTTLPQEKIGKVVLNNPVDMTPSTNATPTTSTNSFMPFGKLNLETFEKPSNKQNISSINSTPNNLESKNLVGWSQAPPAIDSNKGYMNIQLPNKPLNNELKPNEMDIMKPEQISKSITPSFSNIDIPAQNSNTFQTNLFLDKNLLKDLDNQTNSGRSLRKPHIIQPGIKTSSNENSMSKRKMNPSPESITFSQANPNKTDTNYSKFNDYYATTTFNDRLNNNNPISSPIIPAPTPSKNVVSSILKSSPGKTPLKIDEKLINTMIMANSSNGKLSIKDMSILRSNALNVPKSDIIHKFKSTARIVSNDSKKNQLVASTNDNTVDATKSKNNKIRESSSERLYKIKLDMSNKASLNNDNNNKELSISGIRSLPNPNSTVNQTNNNNTNNKGYYNDNNMSIRRSSILDLNNEQLLGIKRDIIDHEKNDYSLIRSYFDQAYALFNEGNAKKTLKILKKIESDIEKHVENEQKIDFEFINLLYNNYTVCYYKEKTLDFALLYAESIALNIKISKKQRKQIQQNYPGRTMAETMQYFTTMNQRLQIKSYNCKSNMQICIILSELSRHHEALVHAKAAARYACELLIDTLLSVYYLLQKSRDVSKSSSFGIKKNVNEDQTPLKDYSTQGSLTTMSTKDPKSSTYQSNGDMDTVESIISGISSIENLGFDIGSNLNMQHNLKMIPILEELVKRLLDTITDDKRQRLLQLMKKLSSNLLLEDLDLNNLYSNVTHGHWLFEADLMNVLQLKYLNTDWLNPSMDLNDEIKADSIIEKITMVVASFYSVATEIRFITNNEDTQNNPNELSESEIWMSKTIEVAYLFLPHDAPITSQIFTVYSKFHTLSRQIIMEDEETHDVIKYLRPFRGGFTTDYFIPIIRIGKSQEWLLKPQKQLQEIEEEQVHKEADRILNLLKRNFCKTDGIRVIKHLNSTLKKIYAKIPPSSLNNKTKYRNQSVKNFNEPDISANLNDSPNKSKQFPISKINLRQKAIHNSFFNNDNQSKIIEPPITTFGNFLESENLNQSQKNWHSSFSNEPVKYKEKSPQKKRPSKNPHQQISEEILQVSDKSSQLTKKINNRGFLSELNLKKNIFNPMQSIIPNPGSSSQTADRSSTAKVSINDADNGPDGFQSSSTFTKTNNNNGLNQPTKENKKEFSDDGFALLAKLVPRPIISGKLRNSSEKTFRNPNNIISIKHHRFNIVDKKSKSNMRTLDMSQGRDCRSISPDHGFSVILQDKDNKSINLSHIGENISALEIKKDAILSILNPAVEIGNIKDRPNILFQEFGTHRSRKSSSKGHDKKANANIDMENSNKLFDLLSKK